MHSKNKFLLICDSLLPPVVTTAGVKNIYNLHKRLTDYGIDLHVLTSTTKWTSNQWPEWVERQSMEGVILHVIDAPLKKFEGLWFLWTRFAYLVRAYFLWKTFGYQIIHDYSSSPLLLNRSGLLRKLTKAKTIHTLATAPSAYNGNKRSIAFLPDLIIYSSDYMRKNLRFRINGIRSQVLPIPISNRFFRNYRTSVPSCRKNGSRIILLYSGLLRKNKGIEQLLDVLPKIIESCPYMDVLIVTPPEREHSIADPLISLTQSSKFRAHRLDGLLSLTAGFGKRVRVLNEKVDMRTVLDASDIFVYPLTTLHGTLVSASTLIEAMARGKAIVASNLPELGGLLKHQENCLLYPPGDIARFQQSIERLAGDGRLRKSLGDRAKIDSANFNETRGSKKLLQICTHLMHSNG